MKLTDVSGVILRSFKPITNWERHYPRRRAVGSWCLSLNARLVLLP